jgi:hypothetical protein
LLVILPLTVALTIMALLVSAGLDVMRTPEAQLPRFSQAGWLGIVMFVPIFGPVFWFTSGRPARVRHPLGPVGAGGPEDDEAFMRQIQARVEAERRRKEAERRRSTQDADPGAEPPSAAA